MMVPAMYNTENKHDYLSKGLKCLQRGDFFDAHEEWEISWKGMNGYERSFWQAMIQLSVGAHHFQNNNLTGCCNLWNKALKRCDAILANKTVRDRNYVQQLKGALTECLQKAETGQNPLPAVQVFATDIVTEDWFDFE
jgi:predicted metal-dependent hydrolase